MYGQAAGPVGLLPSSRMKTVNRCVESGSNANSCECLYMPGLRFYKTFSIKDPETREG